MTKIVVALSAQGIGFDATDESGRLVRFDTAPDHGGIDYGIRPMHGLLMSLGSCSGVDMLSILKKKRQEPQSFRMEIEGEREKEATFSLWKKVHVRFIFSGEIGEDQARQAASLSIDKYCSVAETLRRAGCTITWDVVVNAG